jgi:hypothetical protein
VTQTRFSGGTLSRGTDYILSQCKKKEKFLHSPLPFSLWTFPFRARVSPSFVERRGGTLRAFAGLRCELFIVASLKLLPSPGSLPRPSGSLSRHRLGVQGFRSFSQFGKCCAKRPT